MTTGENFDPVLLIHGAWAGAWVWDRLTPLLTRAGLDCRAIDLPGNGADATPPARIAFEDYLTHTKEWISGGRTPVSLVAHSGGGNVASAYAERWPEEVSRIVYVAGIMLPNGMSFIDVVEEAIKTHPDAGGVNPATLYSEDGLVSRVPPEAGAQYFFNDCSTADAEAAARRLTPQGEGGRAVIMRTSTERFGRIPRLYVEALRDKSVIPAVQKLMLRLSPGAGITTLDTGHAPQYSAPDDLAAAIVPFLKAPVDVIKAPSRPASQEPGSEAR